MTTIRFHRVDNSEWGRYHSTWYKKFSKYLEQFFQVEWIDYYKNDYVGNSHINTINDIGSFEKNPPLCDVDCIIENLDTKKFTVLTFTEYFNSYVVHYLKSQNCQSLLSAHFNYHNIFYWLKRDMLVNCIDKVKPWIFGSFVEWDIQKYRNIRAETPIDKRNKDLFWKGSGIGSYRQTLKHLSEINIIDYQSIPIELYFEQLAKQKIALSFYMDLHKYTTPYDHPGEFCYRDMEYCALGVPFIRIEFKDSVHNGLIPNFHYISIPREHAHLVYSKDGDLGVANLIKEKYLEIINEDDLLSYISRNQQKWFNKNCLWPNSAELAIKLSGIDKWIT